MADQVTFHYIKSTQFRVVHADGIIGSITPRGLIHFAIFNERPAIPQQVTHELRGSVESPAAELGDEKSRVGKEGIVRELEFDVLMDREIVRQFHTWLGDQLKQLDALKDAVVTAPFSAKKS